MSSIAAFAVGVVAALAVLLAVRGELAGGSDMRGIASSVPALLPYAILGGQAIALFRLGLALVANPLTHSYLRHLMAHPLEFQPGPVPGEPAPVGGLLVEQGLHPVITVSDVGDEPRTVTDLYQSSERLVTAAVSRQTGAVSLLTALSDGRVAHTASLQLPPHERLVVNTIPKADVHALLDAHRSLLGTLALRGVRPAVATPRIWLETAQLEHESWCQLGPAVGALCNLSGARGLGRLLVRVPAEAVLDLALPAGPDSARQPGTSALAHAFGAAAPA